MRYWILSCVNQVNHVERLIPAAFKKCQAAGSIAFCADEGSTDKTRTRRRFVRKSSPHCSSTNRRLANPMRKKICTTAQTTHAAKPANRLKRKSATAYVRS